MERLHGTIPNISKESTLDKINKSKIGLPKTIKGMNVQIKEEFTEGKTPIFQKENVSYSIDFPKPKVTDLGRGNYPGHLQKRSHVGERAVCEINE